MNSGKVCDGFHFLNITDSGGQAPFIDIAPSLFPYNLLNLVVFKLTESLKSDIVFPYSIHGKLVGSEKRKISRAQLIGAAFSSKTKIHKPQLKGLVYSESFERPLFMTLGTFYDEYKKNEDNLEKLTEKNIILEDGLKGFEDVVIPNGDDIIFPLNTLSRENETEEMAEMIRELASEYYAEMEVPVMWYLFQIAIEEKKWSEEEIIPFSTFSQIGKEHNMGEKETKAALSYLHDLNMCLYYPDVLPQVVFTSPQYLFDKISEIIAIALNEIQILNEKKKEVFLVKSTQDRLKKEGVFTTKFLSTKLPNKFLDKSFSVDDFLDLMCHLHIVAPLSTEKDIYFMPCLLETIDDPTQNLNISAVEPLLFSWSKTVPNGLFVSLASWLTHPSRFQVNTSKKQYCNKITFGSQKLASQIVIFECPAFIGLANTSSQYTSERSSTLLEIVLEGIYSIVKDFKWLDTVAYPETAYLCKIPKCDLKHPHLCYLDEEQKCISCSEDSGLAVRRTDAHLVWFEQKGTFHE